MLKFQEKENIQWCKLGPRAMFGKFILDIAKIEKKYLLYLQILEDLLA